MSRSVPRVALVTCAQQPDLHAEEAHLLPMLRALGVLADAVVWDDAGVDWGGFDAVVLRSTWDYFTRYPEFCAWLDRLEGQVPVWNRPALLRWNADKRYLRELEQRGVCIVPTAFCEPQSAPVLREMVRERGWDRVVLKPAVSGGAFRTHRFEARDAASYQAALDDILTTTAALIQPFFPEIQDEGEWSFFFFDGAFHFAVLKVPQGDDYRVQPEFGGTYTRVVPEAWMLEQVQGVLGALPEAPAYARIDGVRRGRTFHLMEAELIEPFLYLRAAPEAAEAYARTVARLARAPRAAR